MEIKAIQFPPNATAWHDSVGSSVMVAAKNSTDAYNGALENYASVYSDAQNVLYRHIYYEGYSSQIDSLTVTG